MIQKTKNPQLAKFWFFLLLLLFVACATSPTGRKQFLVMPDDQMNEMGSQAFGEMKSKALLESNSKINSYVKCIAQKIANQAQDQTGVKSWEVIVFRDKQVNAFALPGGKIGVYTGILPVANSQHQLAAILGHEVGHVIARHSNERVSQSVATDTALATVAAMMKTEGPRKNMLMAALGLGAQFGVALPHSRAHENEADLIGLKLMAQAGFDPRESVVLWQNMAKASEGAPPEFMSTHPANSTRIANLSNNMEEALSLYTNAQKAGQTPNCGKLE